MCGTDVLYEVKEKEEMKEQIHRFMVAIVWRKRISNSPKIGRGSGILISQNLVLTVAHNFYFDRDRVEDNCFELFVGQSGPMLRPYKIEAVFTPN